MPDETYLFNLNDVMQYSKDGDFHETATLEFRPPLMNEYQDTMELAQLVMGAMIEARKYADDSGSENQMAEDSPALNIKPEELQVILLASQEISFIDIVNKFKSLAIKTGTFDGKIKLTEDKLNTLAPKEYTQMVCGYIANFTLPSLF